MARLAGLARAGQLAIEDMEGGTFTISNGGVFGSLFGKLISGPNPWIGSNIFLNFKGNFEDAHEAYSLL